MSDSCTASVGEIELDVGVLVSFESGKDVLLGSPKHIMNFMDLIKLILTREQREQRKNLKEHAPHAPYIHLIVIVALCE